MIPDLDRYLFDLRGYIILRNAIPAEILSGLNASLDDLRHTPPGEWNGRVHGHFFASANEGLNLQQIYEAGAPWEFLIDNPAWIDHVKTFVGGQDTFDSKHGELFIDENFASVRGPGQAIGFHSGAVPHAKRTAYSCRNGQISCGQVNVLMALSDIGPGDGATMLVPGSHKSNFVHPQFAEHRMTKDGGSVDGVEAAIEVHLGAGDVVVFVDACAHGSAARVNEGERRIAVYRYGPSWGFFRHPYRPSPELLDRLTERRRKIVMPHERFITPEGEERYLGG